jgi:hypothetical protein
MDFKFDPPVHENTPQFSSWIARQLERISEAFVNTQEERKGVVAVTGNLIQPTGLKRVQYCIAGFANDPNLAAFTLCSFPDATAGAIRIRVFNNNAVLSTSPINVAWFAYGFS